MKAKIFLALGLLVSCFATDLYAQTETAIEQQKNWMVRLAKIEIDTLYLKQYRAAIQEQAKAALELEPGVLTLYAMYDKTHPERVTVLEIYASKEAYQLHIKKAHFLKYKTGTLHMVKSLELVDVEPIAFRTKPNLWGTGE